MKSALSAIDKVAFTIGGLEVRWYGIIIVIGMILGLIYICVECKRIKLQSDDAVELFLWLIPLAIIFARLLYIVVRPDEYFPWNSTDDFVHAIAIWDGGITIVGGILGGLIGLAIFTYRKRRIVNFWQVIDLVVPPLLVGQIVGRLGNFINQEAFGIAITNPKLQTFPFAVYIDNPSGIEIQEGWHGEGWYAATFFYEMVWNTIGLSITYAVWRKNKRYPGILGFFYFVWYFLGRGMLEFLRLDAVPITKIACFIVAPLALIAGILYMLSRSSILSFKKVNDAVNNNILYVTELTPYDVKNYKFVCKTLANEKNPLRALYRVKDFMPVDIDAEIFLEAPPKERKRKKRPRKNADRSL